MARPPLPKTLNVCLVTRKFPIWGRASEHGFLWVIARGLAQKGHTVTVLSSENFSGKSEIEEQGVKVFYLNQGKPGRRAEVFADRVKTKFEELHSLKPFHILHSVDTSAKKISPYKDDYKLAVAYDVEATQMSQLFAIMGMAQETLGSLLATSFAVAYKFLRTFFRGDRQLLKTADGVFVSSPQQRIALERYYLYPDAHIYSVPYGIEIGDLAPREKSEEFRKHLGVPETAKVIMTITDMTDVGEIQNLLFAFADVVTKKPNARMIIIGNGPKFKDIEYEVLNLALGSKVIFAGAVSNTEIPNYIALADAFVNLSSRTTGFEPSLLEAMSQKKVIIGSEVSPIATIVEHGRDGFLIRPADVSELSILLHDLFGERLPTLEIGENARQKVTGLFDPEKMVRETIDAYYAILRSTGYYSRKS